MVITALIEAGANPNNTRVRGGGTPLFVAAAEGHAGVVRMPQQTPFLSASGKTARCKTPLDAAAGYKRSEVVRELIQ